jgi:hypothetical protein
VGDEVNARRDLDRRMERVAWALFLIMIGGLGLVPDSSVPNGLWLVGAGLIMLGLNSARYLNGIRVSGFTVVVGLIAVGSGFTDMTGRDLPLLPIILILIGGSLLYRSFFERNAGRSNDAPAVPSGEDRQS